MAAEAGVLTESTATTAAPLTVLYDRTAGTPNNSHRRRWISTIKPDAPAST